jgi:methanogenic corrinoid protein MtbC1
MLEHLEAGLSAGEAARIVTVGAEGTANGGSATQPARPLAEALDALDEPGAHASLDQLFAGMGVERALAEVVIPYLHGVGERWACGEITVAEEHFASRLLHSRLLGAARGWDEGDGPRAILACPPGEEHDLPLIAFGIALRHRGWRVTYLGANTPIAPIARLAADVRADAVVLAAITAVRFTEILGQLRELADEVPVFVAGAGANAKLAADAGAQLIEGDPVTGAVELALERRS